ncbi:MAG: hypothetical protein KJ587_19620 [Alphaproteobacteria bacterium]|nr:hypothetical protein [Alphaproteobacteria bacterium]
MKLLIIGQCFEDYGCLPYQAAHKSEERDVHLSAELVKLGWSVDLLTGKGDQRLSTGVQQVNWGDVDPDDYHWILVTHYRGFWNLNEHPETKEKVFEHQRVAANLDGFYRDSNQAMGNVRIVGATTAPLAAEYSKMFSHLSTIVTPYGFPEFDPLLPNPYPTRAPVVLYVGCFITGALHAINEIAREGLGRWEVWIAGLFTGAYWAAHGDGPTLNDKARAELFHENVHFISDLKPWRYPNVSWKAGHLQADYEAGQIVGGHGPVNRSEIDPFVLHADVAVSFVEHLDSTLSCKLFDYLGAGVPTLSEEGPPNAGDILSLSAGRVGPRSMMPAFICNELAVPRDRAKIRTAAQALGGWPVIAQRWDHAMRVAL